MRVVIDDRSERMSTSRNVRGATESSRQLPGWLECGRRTGLHTLGMSSAPVLVIVSDGAEPELVTAGDAPSAVIDEGLYMMAPPKAIAAALADDLPKIGGLDHVCRIAGFKAVRRFVNKRAAWFGRYNEGDYDAMNRHVTAPVKAWYAKADADVQADWDATAD